MKILMLIMVLAVVSCSKKSSDPGSGTQPVTETSKTEEIKAVNNPTVDSVSQPTIESKSDSSKPSTGITSTPGTTTTVTNKVPEPKVISTTENKAPTKMQEPKRGNEYVGGTEVKTSTIEVVKCPAGYIKVPFNQAVGTLRDFCVAKYEMRGVAGKAVSRAQGTPWSRETQDSAVNLCKNLGSSYALISNEEWMTIARNVELVGTNWTSGKAGSGSLMIGHAFLPGKDLEASNDDSNGYYGILSSSQVPNAEKKNQRRTLTLSNGEVIWDLSGSLWEWVSWNIEPSRKAYVSYEREPSVLWHDFLDLDRNIDEASPMRPSTWASSFIKFSNGLPIKSSSLNASNGLGHYFGSSPTRYDAVARGGSWGYNEHNGIYALFLGFDRNESDSRVGFRCVYRL